MVCFFPVRAYPSAERSETTGKYGRTFSGFKALINGSGPLYSLPCGVCKGCRIDRAEGWAIRSAHEAQMATETGTGSSFITLTYRKEDLPPDNSVSLHTFQKFMKRLRKGLPGVTVRYQASAEYGAPSVEPDPLWASALGRAHYHAIIFGYDFPDKVPFKKHRNHMLYTSPLLTDWWPFGYHWIGSVSFHSARYVASYVMKKLGGDRAEEHYVRTNRITGEVVPVDPEFQVMSKNPGLGQSWFQKYKSDVYPSDFVVIDGKPRKPPRYYDKQLPEAELEAIKRVRRAKSLLKPEERTDERMWTRNLCAALRIERVEKDRELAGHV